MKASPEEVLILERIALYAQEDRAVTPGFTRLARALGELRLLREKRLSECASCKKQVVPSMSRYTCEFCGLPWDR